MSEPSSIQIVLCAPDGEKKKGPAITPCPAPRRQFDDKVWDKDQSVREFNEFLQRRDSYGLKTAMRDLDQLISGTVGTDPDLVYGRHCRQCKWPLSSPKHPIRQSGSSMASDGANHRATPPGWRHYRRIRRQTRLSDVHTVATMAAGVIDVSRRSCDPPKE
jgi:hypothetical protein